jgi:hypothetical protein
MPGQDKDKDAWLNNSTLAVTQKVSWLRECFAQQTVSGVFQGRPPESQYGRGFTFEYPDGSKGLVMIFSPIEEADYE